MNYKMVNIAPKIKEEILAMREQNEVNSGADLVNAYGKGLVSAKDYRHHLKRLERPKKYTLVYVLAFLFMFGSVLGASALNKHGKLPKALKFLIKK